MKFTCRPIEQWPEQLTPDSKRTHSRFDAPWGSTVDLLGREVAHLGGSEVVLQLAVTEAELRNDGWVRAGARPQHPGVIVSFESKHGPLRCSTDQFKAGASGWQANVRAVALGLEALRKVDRYGIARGGEQYRGWNALPAGTPMGGPLTVDAAVELLAEYAPGMEWDYDDSAGVRGAFRVASRSAHPDAGGDAATFRRLVEARDLLLGTAS